MINSLALKDIDVRKKHNLEFINNEKIEYSDFFNNVESDLLTEKQKDAVITNEENTLIIAGAGSGKTSVMVAKVGYLIKRYKVDPENILLLSFNKKASVELKDRIKKKLNIDMDSQTFHALGMSIIGELDGKKPTLAPWAEGSQKMKNLLQEIIDNLFEKDEKFASQMMDCFQRLFYKYENKFDFKEHREYINYMKSVEMRSFKGDLVKSYEDVIKFK